MVPGHLNRRRFVRQAALAGAAPWICGSLAAGKSPNEKLDIAVIGCGGRGAANLAGVAGENIVALCDVDERQAKQAFEHYRAAKKYRDYRKMLGEVGKRVDAVVISTPDHTHAPAAVMAMKMGKHCYCEKPMAHTVYETRVMSDLAKKNKLATQLGTQVHAEDNYHRTVELVQAGRIGPVSEVHVWFGGGYGGGDRPKDAPLVPPELDWDLWLGPAPLRPYHPCYLPSSWRRWWDFGCGSLGDFGCHYMDLPFWALGLRHATSIEAEGPPPHAEGTPPWCIIRYQFPARDKAPPVKLTWYDGGKRPALVEQGKVPNWQSAVLFVGQTGMLLADYGQRKLLPEAQFKDFQPPKKTIPDSVGHYQEWIQACKTGSPTACNFDDSGVLSEHVLLGNVAYRLGKKLDWDPVNLKVANCPEADKLLRPSYRDGWAL
jgi:predicted dehydrogenase